MHQERNVAESIVTTCMNFPEKSKDNKQARKDLTMICHRPSLELSTRGMKPQALLCMKAKERKEVEERDYGAIMQVGENIPTRMV
jgi:hypothetical protein